MCSDCVWLEFLNSNTFIYIKSTSFNFFFFFWGGGSLKYKKKINLQIKIQLYCCNVHFTNMNYTHNLMNQWSEWTTHTNWWTTLTTHTNWWTSFISLDKIRFRCNPLIYAPNCNKKINNNNGLHGFTITEKMSSYHSYICP